jgi:hypothetical protein
MTFDSFLKLALELDILKIKDQYDFLSPLNLDKQYIDMMNIIIESQTMWENRLTSIGKISDEWRENFYMLSKSINEEKLGKRVLLLRYKMIEEETK